MIYVWGPQVHRAHFTKKLCFARSEDGIIQMPSHLQLPYFYLLPKIHKTPWKTWPVVNGVSDVNEYLSKWIDIQLQQVIYLCPAYLKDSLQLLQELRVLPPLPPNAICFTANAVPMYTNIDNRHGIKTIGRWLNLHRAELPPDFPLQKILESLGIIMRNNVFLSATGSSNKRTAQPYVPHAHRQLCYHLLQPPRGNSTYSA
jgi:hypothetical protein